MGPSLNLAMQSIRETEHHDQRIATCDSEQPSRHACCIAWARVQKRGAPLCFSCHLMGLYATYPWNLVPSSPNACFGLDEHQHIAADAKSSWHAHCIASMLRKWVCPCVSHCHLMGLRLDATDLWDQELFCSLIQIQISCSEQTMSSSGMKTVCWLKEHWSKSSKDRENIWNKNLLELGAEVTELLVETEKNWATRERIGKGCLCMLAAS
jgi:hypothetical protein